MLPPLRDVRLVGEFSGVRLPPPSPDRALGVLGDLFPMSSSSCGQDIMEKHKPWKAGSDSTFMTNSEQRHNRKASQ